ncbi:FIST signal transduction protein [Leptodesmis sp.]|uniref:FIST signal transduction protein n=1 Tax=Leptodesmis sp. TaxID=3100501 RepID=UPI0040534E5D
MGWQPALSSLSQASAQLILLFGSPALLQPSSPLHEILTAYPHAYVLGCSTAGEICDTQVSDNSLVATIIQFEHTEIHCYFIHLLPEEGSFEAGKRLSQLLSPHGLTHVFVLSDGLQVNGSELVKGLGCHLPPHIGVTGGLSGDGDRFQQTFILCNGQVNSGMIAVLGLYGDRLRVGYASQGGWSPFGPERVITKSRGNILYELDGEPALELYKRYLGDHAAELPAAGLFFPLSLRLETGNGHLVRTILSINEAEQSLTFAGDMPEGTIAQLMQASFDRLVEGAIQAAEISHQALGGVPADLAILISCVGRKLLLKQRIEEEVESVREVLGEQTILTGFYSCGEISPCSLGAPCELHNQTMTITTFAET